MAEKMMTLTCKAGHTWTRPSQRGKPPHYCPKHKPGISAEMARKAQAPKNIRKAPEPVANIAAPQITPVKASQASLPPGGITLGPPQGSPYAIGQRDKGTIRPRELAHVSTVRVGDWTNISGFRPVTAVKLFPRKQEIRLWWGEDSETFSFEYKDKDRRGEQRMVRVLRKEDV